MKPAIFMVMHWLGLPSPQVELGVRHTINFAKDQEGPCVRQALKIREQRRLMSDTADGGSVSINHQSIKVLLIHLSQVFTSFNLASHLRIIQIKVRRRHFEMQNWPKGTPTDHLAAAQLCRPRHLGEVPEQAHPPVLVGTLGRRPQRGRLPRSILDSRTDERCGQQQGPCRHQWKAPRKRASGAPRPERR